MGNAKRDDNYIPTLIGVSNVDGVTPVTLYVDPVTHRLLVSAAGGTPSGSDTQVQFNDGGVFGGDAGLTFNKTSNVVTLTGGLVTPLIYPSADSTTALKVTKADGSTALLTFDTTNSRIYLADGSTPIRNNGTYNGSYTGLDIWGNGLMRLNRGSGGQAGFWIDNYAGGARIGIQPGWFDDSSRPRITMGNPTNNNAVDTSIEREAAGTIAIGNATKGDSSGTLLVGKVGVGNSSPSGLDVGTTTAGLNATINATLGTELAPEISGASGVNWTIGAGWEDPIAGGVLNKNADGQGTVDAVTGTITAGTTYKAVVTVQSLTVGSIYFYVGNSLATTITSAGTYTFYLTANNTNKIRFYPVTSASRFVISAVSVKALSNGQLNVYGNTRLYSPIYDADGTLTLKLKGGKVGIGIDPSFTLDVNGIVVSRPPSGGYFQLANYTTNYGQLRGAFSAGFQVESQSSFLSLAANAAEVMRLVSGKVGVGFTSPATTLDVGGDFQVASKVANSLGGYVRKYSEATATMSGATTNIEVNIPAGARILGTQLRVDTLITSGDGGTTWSATYTGGATQAIGAAGQAFTKNTKVNAMFNDTTETDVIASETDITITCAGGTFSAGVVRAIVYYETFTAMGNAA